MAEKKKTPSRSGVVCINLGANYVVPDGVCRNSGLPPLVFDPAGNPVMVDGVGFKLHPTIWFFDPEKARESQSKVALSTLGLLEAEASGDVELQKIFKANAFEKYAKYIRLQQKLMLDFCRKQFEGFPPEWRQKFPKVAESLAHVETDLYSQDREVIKRALVAIQRAKTLCMGRNSPIIELEGTAETVAEVLPDEGQEIQPFDYVAELQEAVAGEIDDDERDEAIRAREEKKKARKAERARQKQESKLEKLSERKSRVKPKGKRQKPRREDFEGYGDPSRNRSLIGGY
ncbi:hypothetical protein A3K34_02650 [candidate division WWE3 bacterium RIFOXYC1_FULL_40_10]|uniref:Uncharacterized protein n=1 Tax=candidate division WWE3 bacterium RIFOXYA2_FULL_46_9 TaxID=1802636 RepID=A0A1F4W2Y1_UNCKA|nr:MAG: hypothetical protein A3K58_02650 [candidate division WWE3 bacterium RIFOXYB1_FULL_40_22]OGC61746.1 MAG: hypothetical protein A3K37_02650 [candidate division WWE3 bacterium RIFOXYA1_FULL_40_11]OGC63730.1 MAG: hypothetical protein A2264_05140 [candidate division WWE3 bacterium RIFOXYA2_FULL_46_9]OGC65204.1 MAG: hypothetical protein A2326_02500 [candidate division WWE3 bacterium RIFOXYB2_FULL_41_6]OGC66129.1 MAG: hypothetical protein A3K34_02650 [candidate division WWE3 bacterium RIFOXYC1_